MDAGLWQQNDWDFEDVDQPEEVNGQADGRPDENVQQHPQDSRPLPAAQVATPTDHQRADPHSAVIITTSTSIPLPPLLHSTLRPDTTSPPPDTRHPSTDLVDAILHSGSSSIPRPSAQRQLEEQASRAEQPPHLATQHNPRRPVGSHQDNWLDLVTLTAPSVPQTDYVDQYISDLLIAQPATTTPSPESLSSEGDLEAATQLQGSETGQEERQRAGQRREHRGREQETSEQDTSDRMPPQRSARRNSRVVDLTQDSPPQPAAASVAAAGTSNETTRKRRARSDASSNRGEASNSFKRSRIATGAIEEIDLAGDAISAEEAIRQARQQDLQNDDEDGDAPQRLGKRCCVICMENFTNITATHCGHFYCHECLIRSLIASEKVSDRGTGNCPICRKNVSRSKTRGTRKQHHIIPIAFMTKAGFEMEKTRRSHERNI